LESKIAIKHFPVQQEVIDSNNKFYQLHSNFSTNGSCSYAPVYHEIGKWGVGRCGSTTLTNREMRKCGEIREMREMRKWGEQRSRAEKLWSVD
jgi:hypothetical protein